MSEQIKSKLTDNEILFMKRMEIELLPNRQHVSTSTLKEVGALVGISINASCRSCTQAGGVDLLNKYGLLKTSYEEYKSQILTPYPYHETSPEKEIVKSSKKIIK